MDDSTDAVGDAGAPPGAARHLYTFGNALLKTLSKPLHWMLPVHDDRSAAQEALATPHIVPVLLSAGSANGTNGDIDGKDEKRSRQ